MCSQRAVFADFRRRDARQSAALAFTVVKCDGSQFPGRRQCYLLRVVVVEAKFLTLYVVTAVFSGSFNADRVLASLH